MHAQTTWKHLENWLYRACIVCVWGLCHALALPAQDDTSSILALVSQLGSAEFAMREEATDKLRSFGLAALPAMRHALTNPDAEVRRRAVDLVGELEKLELTRKALEPRKISLKLIDAPVQDAVAAFAKAFDASIELKDPKDRLKDRRLNLILENVAAWEALRLLKLAAGLHEKIPDNEEEEQPDPGMFARRRNFGRMPRTTYEVAPFRLLLVPRADREAPDMEDTRLGIRATLVPGESGKYGLALHSQPDSRILAIKTVTPRTPDSNGTKLVAWKHVTSAKPPEVQRRGAWPPSPFPKGVPPRMEAYLESVVSDSGHSKILAGTAVVDLVQVGKPLVTVNDLGGAEGKSFDGRDGAKLEVKQVLQVREGQFQIRLEVVPRKLDSSPPVAANDLLPLPQVLQGIAPGQPRIPNPPIQALPGLPQAIVVPNFPLASSPVISGEFRFSLAGRVLSPGGTSISTIAGPQGTRHEVTFILQLRGSLDLDGVVLEWISQDLVSLEVPFEFRDVPSP